MFPVMLRRLAPVLSTLLACLLLSASVRAAETPYPEIVPCVPDILLYDNVAMAPLLPLAQALGITVTVDEASLDATATLENHTLVFHPKSDTALCDDVETALPLATYTTESGLLYVPVKTLINGLGGSMEPNMARGILAITVPKRDKPLDVPFVEANTQYLGKDMTMALYAMNLDGSNVRRLTYDAGCWQLPVFIPNIPYFLYSRNGAIVQRTAENPAETRLPRPSNATINAQFYPSGYSAVKRLLVFRNESAGVYSLRVGEREPKLLNRDGMWPCMTPDGTSIAYLQRQIKDGKTQPTASFYLMSADGSNNRLIDTSADLNSQPVFSPDGSLLAYKRMVPQGDQGYRSIVVFYLMTGANAGKTFAIPRDALQGYDRAFTFSADSQWVSIVNDANGLQIMKPDRTQATRLASDALFHISLSPDGTQVAYTSRNSTIRLVSRDGKKNEMLLQDAKDIRGLTFTPDGKQILFLAKPFRIQDQDKTKSGNWW